MVNTRNMWNAGENNCPSWICQGIIYSGNMFVLGSKRVEVSMMSWREAWGGGELAVMNIAEALGLRYKQWEMR